jgi:hypothetical protein
MRFSRQALFNRLDVDTIEFSIWIWGNDSLAAQDKDPRASLQRP